MKPLVTFKGIAREYRQGGQSVQALSRISMEIDRGEFVAVTGPSGSGKSTLLSILGLLDHPSRGEYLLDGQSVFELTLRRLAEVRNRRIGFVFQDFKLLPDLTALENVGLPLFYRRERVRDSAALARAALEQVGLAGRIRHFPAQLSGGEQQRVAIARAIVNHPDLLLADEPTGALDTATRDIILALFARLHRTGLTVLLVTHDAEVAAHAQRTIRLRDGTIVAGPETAISQRSRISAEAVPCGR
ncbi:MAG: ABC transporter ATP-binding protein [Alphaproteobacteria bacterium]|nr:ABC transporter ATP-binding protein [Alphaproteobacteria bacterium]